MDEKWLRWKPIAGLQQRYYDTALYNDKNGLEIILIPDKGNNNKVRVFFEDGVDAHRETRESFRIEEIPSLDEDIMLNGSWSFFKVENSEYIKWLSKTSLEILIVENYTHFCFITYNSIVDVISNYEPKVEIIE